jgi:glycosyltransferase involved in cell wall biosynthesis
MFAEFFCRSGLRCKVLRPGRKDPQSTIQKITPYHQNNKAFSFDDLIFIENRFQLIKELNNAKSIVSIGGALPVFLGRLLWPFRNILNLPPVIHFSTGSDITERAIENTYAGDMYRQYLKFTKINVMLVYPQAIKNITKLCPPNVVFLRYPYYLLDNILTSTKTDTSRIRLFHPSNLDWNGSNSFSQRVSTKGNDRFIRALARAINAGMDIECTMLDRGKDRELAHQMINDLNITENVIWKPHLDRYDLIREMVEADVIIDQFDVGGFGGIAAEAMSIAKPVMIYIDESTSRILYPEMPPVMNCQTEDEIFLQLINIKNKESLIDFGRQAQNWVIKYHSFESVKNGIMFYYSMVTSK